jgi:predicted ferric reductase
MNHEYWYLSRAAGFTAYLLLFASVVTGIATSTRLGARLKLGNLPFDLHRFLSLLAVAFTVFHVYILLGDGYANYSVWQLSVPFLSPYRTLSVAVGMFAFFAMLLVVGSFYVRRFIGYRAWRTLHVATFGLYAAATAHGLYAGTDTGAWWARDIYLLTVAGVLLATAYRMDVAQAGGSVSGGRHLIAATTAGIAVVVTFVASAFVGIGVATLSQ